MGIKPGLQARAGVESRARPADATTTLPRGSAPFLHHQSDFQAIKSRASSIRFKGKAHSTGFVLSPADRKQEVRRTRARDPAYSNKTQPSSAHAESAPSWPRGIRLIDQISGFYYFSKTEVTTFNAVEMTSTLENPLKPVIMELISEPDSQKVIRSMKSYKVAQNSYFLNQSTYLLFFDTNLGT